MAEVIATTGKVSFLRSKRVLIVAILLLAASGFALWWFVLRNDAKPDPDAIGPVNNELVVVPPPSEEEVKAAQQTIMDKGVVFSIAGDDVVINGEKGQVSVKLVAATSYQKGESALDGKKEELVAGQSVQFSYNSESKEAGFIWYR